LLNCEEREQSSCVGFPAESACMTDCKWQEIAQKKSLNHSGVRQSPDFTVQGLAVKQICLAASKNS
jgi:hypothetical protein